MQLINILMPHSPGLPSHSHLHLCTAPSSSPHLPSPPLSPAPTLSSLSQASTHSLYLLSNVYTKATTLYSTLTSLPLYLCRVFVCLNPIYSSHCHCDPIFIILSLSLSLFLSLSLSGISSSPASSPAVSPSLPLPRLTCRVMEAQKGVKQGEGPFAGV